MKNNKQQTAVEWLVEQMPTAFKNLTINKKIIQQAKEMEKQQIINSHLTGLIHPLEMEATKQAEQYYKETYGGEK
jgi:predicted oxidoreductase (fatty acid repression mutant protein)